MLSQRIRAYIEPRLRPGEEIRVAMAGFRPLSRSAALLATFPLALGGFAVSAASGTPAWVGGTLGAGAGVGLAMWLDQRRARAEHEGRCLSIGLVVTGGRLFILDLSAGLAVASVDHLHLESELGDIAGIETETMQGSGFKRVGAVLRFRDGSVERVIPARTRSFLEALEGS